MPFMYTSLNVTYGKRIKTFFSVFIYLLGCHSQAQIEICMDFLSVIHSVPVTQSRPHSLITNILPILVWELKLHG